MKNSLLLVAVVIILAVAHVARSQGTEGPPAEPTVVGGSVDGAKIYRFWSDGSVDFSQTSTPNCSRNIIVCVGIPLVPATGPGDVIRLPGRE